MTTSPAALPHHPVALTIAGSDSGGGAGIQADLKAFSYFGVYGISAITAVTAQNPHKVYDILPVTPQNLTLQLEALAGAFTIQALKTGMLFDCSIIEAVAAFLDQYPPPNLVIDPVMVATSGAELLRPDARDKLVSCLLPRATVITPNIPEAEILLNEPVRGLEDAIQAAQWLSEHFEAFILLKGGHRSRDQAVDVLSDKSSTWVISTPALKPPTTHGTGCMLSAALAANLATGYDMPAAARRAKAYVTASLNHTVAVGDRTWAMLPPNSLPLDQVTINTIR